jgi:hypothetical protein
LGNVEDVFFDVVVLVFVLVLVWVVAVEDVLLGDFELIAGRIGELAQLSGEAIFLVMESLLFTTEEEEDDGIAISDFKS